MPRDAKCLQIEVRASRLSSRGATQAGSSAIDTKIKRGVYSLSVRLASQAAAQASAVGRGGLAKRGTRMRRLPEGTSLLGGISFVGLSLVLGLCLKAQTPAGQSSPPGATASQEAGKPASPPAASDAETLIHDTP